MPLTRRLIIQTIDGQYGINGLVDPQQTLPSDITLPDSTPLKLVRVTKTYVLYREVGKV